MIKIICCGKIKEKYLQDAINDYLKRLSKYTKVNIIELKDSDIVKEKNEILKYIEKKDYIVTLEIEGNQMTSLDFSKLIDETFIKYANITFIIGGSEGLHDDIKNIKNLALSFSKMTYPHQLFRVILLEQIYRCFKINNNESYHK